MQSVGCVAVAGEGKQSVAMLRRRDGESLKELLARLDLASARAMVVDVYTWTPMKSIRPTNSEHLVKRSWTRLVLQPHISNELE
jgi:hypothetical protein